MRQNVTDIEDYLNAADLGLFSSELESFCLSILEAMTVGCPSAAFRVGGIPEVVVSGESGQLVPFGDTAAMAQAVELLLADPVRRAAFGTAARTRARELFSARRVVGRYLDFYRRLCETKG